MDTSTVSSLIDLYFDDPPDGENDQQIREFFARTADNALALRNMHTAVVSFEECISEPPREPQNDKNSRDFYARFMEEELQKYKKLLKEHRNKVFCDNYYLNSNTSQQILGQNGTFDKKSPWERLCILDYKEQILKTIHENRITIIKGFTGCGKSTQIPQYLAMDCQKQGRPYSIVVTQPRRVAAKMLATRVAAELDCPLGSLVGYQIGLDQAKSNQKTRILYVTTGVLLQRLIMTSGCLRHVTHIILDEVHERSADMDMLFLALKRKIFECDLPVKIILMSATCNVDLFQEYFTLPKYISDTACIDCSPAVLEIRDSSIGSTIKRFKQEIFYLDDIVGKIEDLQSTLKYIENNKRYSSYKEFLRQSSHQIIFNKNYPTVHQALHDAVLAILFHQIEAHQLDNQNRGTVLIFLPGLAEILEVMQALSESPLSARFRWQFSILHSTVSLQEQTDVLKVATAATGGGRHIILATNIAESSLTVPNVEFVLDFCLCKVLMASRQQGCSMTYLALQWSSQSSAEQRAGRTGRTNHGVVFRLVPRRFYESRLEPFEVPEFERTPLENYVLKAKLIEDRLPPKAVLAYALSPPALEDIQWALLTLKRMNALTVNTTAAAPVASLQELAVVVDDGNGENDEEDGHQAEESHYQRDNGNLTTLGYIMALLPMDIRLSKLVALGVVFDCTDEAVVIAAAHCTAGFFTLSSLDPLRSYRAHFEWADRSLSDSLAYLRAYRMYKTVEETFGGVASRAQRWCARHELDYHRLLEMETLVHEVINRLEMNIKINSRRSSFGGGSGGGDRVVHLAGYPPPEQELMLKAIIAGAFYPNYFLRQHSQNSDQLGRKYRQSSGGVNFHDTVIVSGLSRDTATSTLYVPLLHRLFRGCSPNIEYRVDGGTVYMRMDVQSPAIVAAVDIDGFEDDNDGNGGEDDDDQHLPQSASHFWSSCSGSETSVHASVYHALAVKKLKTPMLLRRLPPQIETAHQKQVLLKVQESLFGSIEEANDNNLQTSQKIPTNFTVKVVQTAPKYRLPRTPIPRGGGRCPAVIAVHLTNFLSPQLFFLLYKHAYVERMLANIELLAGALPLGEAASALRRAQRRQQRRPAGGSVRADCQVGDLVLAPLSMHRFKSLLSCFASLAIGQQGQQQQQQQQAKCIWARAEVVRLRTVRNQKTAFIFYIDFGLTDDLPAGCLYPLKCRSPFVVREETRAAFTEQQLADIVGLSKDAQRVHDLLFSIAPLAVQCQLGRVRPARSADGVAAEGSSAAGCWTPPVRTFLKEYCTRNRYAFKAKLYGGQELKELKERPSDRPFLVELYSLHQAEEELEVASLLDLLCGDPQEEEEGSKKEKKKAGASIRSLSELLVAERLAEFRLDSLTTNFSAEGVADFTEETEVELQFDQGQDRGQQLLSPREVTLSLDSIKILGEEKGCQQELSADVFHLRGPTSPLELTFRPLPRLNGARSCALAPSSVNVVALEPETEVNSSSARHARLLVAGEISLSGGGGGGGHRRHQQQQRLLLSHTTLMPNSLDFPALMCMLWAPRVELRVNRLLSVEKSCGLPEEICGVLCGLGFDSRTPDAASSLDPDTDIELLFDSTLTEEDVELVNLVRYHVSQFFYIKQQHITLQTPAGVRLAESLGIEKCLRRRQQLCRRTLLQLLTRSRFRRRWWFQREPNRPAGAEVRPTFRWNMFNCAEQRKAYRAFDFRPFHQAMLDSIDLEKAVLRPINIPILNVELNATAASITSWEDTVLLNLVNMEAGNWSACKDEASNRYLCKLCMFCALECSDLQWHCRSPQHTEASRLFPKYYSAWQDEQTMMKNFARASYEEERAEERRRREEEEEARARQEQQSGEHLNMLEVLLEYDKVDRQIGLIDLMEDHLLPGTSAGYSGGFTSLDAEDGREWDHHQEDDDDDDDDDQYHLDDPFFLTAETPATASPALIDSTSKSALLIDFDDDDHAPSAFSKTKVNDQLTMNDLKTETNTAAINDLRDYLNDDQIALLQRQNLLMDFSA